MYKSPWDSNYTHLRTLTIPLVYSVITQFIWLLPENFSTDKDFGFELFNSLDRSREKLPRALCLMEDLFTLAPRLLIVVIDGHYKGQYTYIGWYCLRDLRVGR